MSEIINGVDTELYIGTVYSINVNTREIEVYIPKLMPAIAEGGKSVEYMTNLGSSNSMNTINYSEHVTIKNTMKVSAYDLEEPMPKVGSKVAVYFLEGNIRFPYWKKFNMHGEYKVIDEEKYPRRAYLQIGDKTVQIDNDDLIQVILPENYDVVLEKSEKTKIFRLLPSSDIDKRLTALEGKVGQEEYIEKTLDIYNNEVSKTIPSTGLVKRVDTLEDKGISMRSRITTLENTITELTTKLEELTKQITQSDETVTDETTE